jgi:hypothetical protein
MFVSCECLCCQVKVSAPRPEESYRLWCVSECYQVKINTLYTYCKQVDIKGKDCENNSVINVQLQVSKVHKGLQLYILSPTTLFSLMYVPCTLHCLCNTFVKILDLQPILQLCYFFPFISLRSA